MNVDFNKLVYQNKKYSINEENGRVLENRRIIIVNYTSNNKLDK